MDTENDEEVPKQPYYTPQQWEDFKPTLYFFYVLQGLPLAKVQEEMGRRGLNASFRMFKSRFSLWNFGKNTSMKDWQAFAILRERGRAAGSELLSVQIHNRIRTSSELQKYLKEKDISEADFVMEALGANISVPDHVRVPPVTTNEAEQVAADRIREPMEPLSSRWTDKTSSSQNSLWEVEDLSIQAPADINMDSGVDGEIAFDHAWFQVNPPGLWSSVNELSLQQHSHHEQPHLNSSRNSVELSRYLARTVNSMRGTMPPGPPFVDLSRIAGHISVPALNPAFSHSTYETSGSFGIPNALGTMLEALPGTRQEVGQVEEWEMFGKRSHSISDDSSIPRFPTPVPGGRLDTSTRYAHTEQDHHLMGSVFMSCMSAAAIYSRPNLTPSSDLARTWMDQAVVMFQKMCTARDGMLLVTIHRILVWVQLHDTASRAESIIREMYQAMAIELGANSPMAMILECMASAAGKKLAKSRIELDTLRRIVQDLGAEWGADHPHTLVATFYMCFHMMAVGKKFADAEEELERLHKLISKILGKSSFLSVCVLAALSRAQLRQGKVNPALDTITDCVEAAPLGLNHPHRLELLLRTALICLKLKDQLKLEETNGRSYWEDRAIKLYRRVVMGRVATLGRYHEETEAAHDTLVQILVNSGRYEQDAVKGITHDLLTKPQRSISEYECWWKTIVSIHGEGEQRNETTHGMG